MRPKILSNSRRIERRRFFRHPMCFPLRYKVIKKEKAKDIREEPSTAKNISRGGLLFSSRRPVRKDVLIILIIPFQDKVFRVRAKVVHCKRDREAKLYDVGVSFERLSEAFKVKLIEQIYLISEYRDLRSMELGRQMSMQEASREWIKRYSERFRRLYW